MFPVRASVPSLRPALVTLTLCAACAVAFFWEVGLPEAKLAAVVQRLGVVPARQWEVLRVAPHRWDLWLVPIFSSMFLHGGWAHLIGNLMFLWVFGDGVENRLGHGRFLAFYTVCGAAAAQAQAWMEPDSVAPMIGASGAIAGVLGAYLALYPLSRVTVLVPVLFLPLFYDLPALLFLGIWFLEQLIAGAAFTLAGAAGSGGVAWWAHVGGFVTGLVLVFLMRDGLHEGYRQPGYRDRMWFEDRY